MADFSAVKIPLPVLPASILGASCPDPLSIVAIPVDPFTVTVNFSEGVISNSELVEPDNYIITGPGSPTTLFVTPGPGVNPTFVTLTTTEHRELGSYSVFIERIQALSEGLLIAPYSGLGDPPQLITAEALSSRSVKACFDEVMLAASGISVVGNWTIARTDFISNIVSVSAVALDNPTYPLCATFELSNDMSTGVLNYRVTASAVFTDKVGNTILAPLFIDFNGVGVPDWIFSPEIVGTDGGYVVAVNADTTLFPAGKYNFTIGGTAGYSTKPGNRGMIDAVANSNGRTYARLGVSSKAAGVYNVVFTNIDTGLTYTAANALEYVLPIFPSQIFRLRAKLPSDWQLGKRSIE